MTEDLAREQKLRTLLAQLEQGGNARQVPGGLILPESVVTLLEQMERDDG